MHKDYEQFFSHLEPQEPAAGLFDRIILAIKQEQELRRTKRLLFGFLFLLIASFIATPLSWTILVSQMENSGILYFVSAAVSDFGTFLTLWQDFGLAILESLPILGIAAFAISVGLALFTLRLFLYKKRLLLGYLTRPQRLA
jgi:ABC-type Fe3+ transport system permease subunit